MEIKLKAQPLPPPVSEEVLQVGWNSPHDTILVVKSEDHYRWTLNPKSRQTGDTNWVAGTFKYWCEVESIADLSRARTAVASTVKEAEKEGWIERVQRAHSTGICIRQNKHWNEEK